MCINGGKISASVDELKAPTSEMIGPRFGTKAARTTTMNGGNNVLLKVSNLERIRRRNEILRHTCE